VLAAIWNTATNTEDKREKIQALSLAKECYGMKLDLLTDATVVDDAIRFVVRKDARANVGSKADADLIVIGKERQQQLLENNSRDRESEIIKPNIHVHKKRKVGY
jgi:hypothetical protein